MFNVTESSLSTTVWFTKHLRVLVSWVARHYPNQRPLCHVRLLLADGSHSLAMLIDSGAEDNIMDEDLVELLGINQQRSPQYHPVPNPAITTTPPEPGVYLTPSPQPTHRLGNRSYHPPLFLTCRCLAFLHWQKGEVTETMWPSITWVLMTSLSRYIYISFPNPVGNTSNTSRPSFNASWITCCTWRL